MNATAPFLLALVGGLVIAGGDPRASAAVAFVFVGMVLAIVMVGSSGPPDDDEDDDGTEEPA